MQKLLELLQSTWVRVGFLAVAFGLCIWALVSQWDEIVAAVSALSVWSLFGALLLGFVYVAATFIAWRVVLRGFGTQIPLGAAAKIFFVSQLGKYLPGGIWNFLAAAELGKDHEIPRSKSVLVMFVSLLLSIATGIVLGALALLFGPAELRDRFWWVVLVLPLVAILLAPPVLNRALALVAKKAKLGTSAPAISGKAVAAATFWSLVAWLLAGGQVWTLAVAMGWELGVDTFLLATAAYSLAWVAGFIMVFAPAGVGVREAVLGAVLAPSIGSAAAIAVVLLSRVLLTIADVVLGVAFVFAGRKHGAVSK